MMVLLANRGISAWEGFSSPFIAAMKDSMLMIAATGIMIAIVWFATSYGRLYCTDHFDSPCTVLEVYF